MKRVEISSTEFTTSIIGAKELAGDSLVEIFHGTARLLLIHFFWTSVRMGLKGMASRMVLRRILHLREKSNLISVLSHDSLSVHFLWKPFGRYLTGIVLGILASLFRIVCFFSMSNLTISLPFGIKVGTFLRRE